jgi:hypothetical protein
MSGIDKDPKSKESKPSDKKFFLGFSDGFLPKEKWMVAALVSSLIRRKK